MAKKIVIASGKGGVGKSSLTAGLSYALADMGHRVLAVDADIGLRCLDIIFDAAGKSVFDWGDVVLGNCEADKAPSCGQGISLLTAPLKFLPEFTQEAVGEMIKKYDDSFDYILIDAPAGLTDGFDLACAMADDGIIVATPDEVCVRGAQAAAESARANGVDGLRLVINRFNRKGIEQKYLLNIDDTIDSASVRLVGVVPENIQILFCFTGGKRLPKNNSARKAFTRIAKRITGEKIPLTLDK